MLYVGAEVDLLDGEGGSPLLEACREGHVEAVRALLAAGAKADLLDTKVGM